MGEKGYFEIPAPDYLAANLGIKNQSCQKELPPRKSIFLNRIWIQLPAKKS